MRALVLLALLASCREWPHSPMWRGRALVCTWETNNRATCIDPDGVLLVCVDNQHDPFTCAAPTSAVVNLGTVEKPSP